MKKVRETRFHFKETLINNLIETLFIGLTVNRIDHFVKKGHLVRLKRIAQTVNSLNSPMMSFLIKLANSISNITCKYGWNSSLKETMVRIEVSDLNKTEITKLSYQIEQQSGHVVQQAKVVDARLYYKKSSRVLTENWRDIRCFHL